MARRPSCWLLFTGMCLTGTLASTSALAENPPLLEPVPAVASDAVDAGSLTPPAADAKGADAAKGDTTTSVVKPATPLAEPSALTQVKPMSEKNDVELVRERFPSGKVKIEREVIRDAEENYINHGKWKMWDLQGNVVGEGHYVNGQREGTWTAWFFANEVPLLAEMPYKQFEGPFTSQAEFHNGKLNGVWTITDGKHRKVSEWSYSDGQRHGQWTSWYVSGHKMREVSYSHGELDGNVSEWSPEGAQVTKDVYQQGRRLAHKVEYYSEKQQKKSEGVYLFAKQDLQRDDEWWEAKLAKFVVLGKDERHGEFTSWHPNGQVQVQGRYEHDVPVGVFTWWYPNGQKATQGSFVNGQRHGEWTWYHENGLKAAHGDFVMGGPNGRWVWWSEAGKVAQKVEYSPGKGDAVKSVVKTPKGASPVVAEPSHHHASGEDSTTAPSGENFDPVPQAATAPEPPVQR